MRVPEIIAVKDQLEAMKEKGLLKAWELPYENLLTRRSAAIFFFTPTDEASLQQVASELEQHEDFSHRLNEEKKLSTLEYRVTFSKEEKEKNSKKNEAAVA
ncbi:MAG TPA: hypothetical protein VD996_04695 [Chitinophagaceae bacterium]|nr:hypothetical protein [Chitinophagaceae bacterium]